MSKATISILFFFYSLSALNAAGNACSTRAAGNWSNTATWTTCGGSVPGDGDTALIQHTVQINQDIGTVAGGGIKNIQIKAAGITVAVDGLAPRTIVFGSTGYNPIGSGTANAPGSDATMYGILLDRGTFDTRAGSTTNFLTIKTADGTHPWYLRHVWGGGGVTVDANLYLWYAKLYNLGYNTGTVWFEGIGMQEADGSGIVNVQYCYFVSPYMALHVQNVQAGFSFSHNTIDGSSAQYTVQAAGAYNSGWQVTDNTDINPGASGVFLVSQYTIDKLQFLRNAVYDSTSYTKGLVWIGAQYTMTGNVMAQYNVIAAQRSDYDTKAIGLGDADSNGVYKNVVDKNVCQTIMKCVWYSGYKNDITNNVMIGNANTSPGQGLIFGSLPTSILNATGNMMAHDSNAGSAGIFSYYGVTPTVAGNTISLFNPDSGNSGGICPCEPGYPSYNAVVKNNVLQFGHNAVAYSAGTTFTSDWGGVGVHHNLNWGNLDTYPYYGYAATGTPVGNNYDDGVHIHPSTVYGDMTENPGLADTSRRIQGFDSLLGGPGTVANFFTQMAARCGLTATVYNSRYTIEGLYSWMAAGFVPLNIRLARASDVGGYIGAKPPMALIGVVQ